MPCVRYDPVFMVETVDGRRIWCKRHYKCTPRAGGAAEGPAGGAESRGDGEEEKAGSLGGSTPGLWTLTTLDNGVASRELWTVVDAADDLRLTHGLSC